MNDRSPQPQSTGYLTSCLIAASALTSAVLSAQGGALGPEVQVNSYTTGDQERSRVATRPDGSFVIVWESEYSIEDLDGFSVQAQIFAADGSPVASQFQVNSYTTGNQQDPVVASNSVGDFTVVWESTGSAANDDDGVSSQGRTFMANGTAQGPQFQINSYTTGEQDDPFVSYLPDDSFVVVWENDQNIEGENDIQGQLFLPNGMDLGSEFLVNTYTTGQQTDPAAAPTPDGGFWIVWESAGGGVDDTDGDTVLARRYSDLGTPVGNVLQLNSYTTDHQTDPSVSTAGDGSFVVAWQSGPGLDDYSVRARQFEPSGQPIGADFQISPVDPDRSAENPDTAARQDGSFVVVWSDDRVFGQRFTADGELDGPRFRVTSPFGRQPTVDTLDNGEFVVTMTSSPAFLPDNLDSGVTLRRYEPFLFADGFESGDLLAWSLNTP